MLIVLKSCQVSIAHLSQICRKMYAIDTSTIYNTKR